MDVAKSYVARRLPAVPSPQIHQRGSSITLLNQKTRIVSRICEHRGGGRGGAGRLAVLFSRLAIPGLRMDRSVNVSLLLVV